MKLNVDDEDMFLQFEYNTFLHPSIQYNNKTGTSKVGVISKAQKAQKTFFKKTWNFWFFFFQKMSHSAEKCKRGDTWGFINIYSVAKYLKNSKGGLFWDIKKISKKVAQCRKKLKGGPFSLFWFCRLRKKG